jgi:hypothetical protein
MSSCGRDLSGVTLIASSNQSIKEISTMTTYFTRKSKLVAGLIAAALLVAPASALASSSQTTATVNWQIALKPSTAFPTAAGSAQYQSQPGQRELQIEVYRLKSLAGKWVVFYVNGVKFGAKQVSSLGIAQITHNTELGQYVPTLVHGSTVSVTTANGGTPIASGTF